MSSVHLDDEQCRRCYCEALNIDAMLQPRVAIMATAQGGLRFASDATQDIEITRSDRTLAAHALAEKIRGMVRK